MTATSWPPPSAYSLRGLPFATTRAAQAVDRAATHIRTYRHGLPERQEQARRDAIAALTDVIVAAAAAKDTLEREGAIPITAPAPWPAAAPTPNRAGASTTEVGAWVATPAGDQVAAMAGKPGPPTDHPLPATGGRAEAPAFVAPRWERLVEPEPLLDPALRTPGPAGAGEDRS